ncbi:MAG: hypothetical protein DRO92_00810 [Candidatus Altiarchaeales archaeon]|nr:MAG: hypothetical protein DRO92_00810 [Candidatus Altiarchaeales archaeon]
MRTKFNIIWFVLIFLIIISISSIVKFLPIISKYSTAPAQFGGGTIYFINHIINTGHILKRGEIQTYGVYSNTIYGQVETPIFSIFHAIRSKILDIPWKSRDLISHITFSIIFSITILLFFYRSEKIEISIITFITIVLFALFGTPQLISNMEGNAALGWIFIALGLYTYTRSEDSRMRLLLIIFSCTLPLMYYTPSMVYLLILVSLVVYKIVIKRDYKQYLGFTLLYLVVWLACSIYIATSRFHGTINVISSIHLLFREGLTGSLVGINEGDIIHYLISTSISNKIKLASNAFFVVIPVIYFLKIGHKRFTEKNRIVDVLWAILISLLPMSFLLFVWLGIWGVMRLVEWGGLYSVIILSSMMSLIEIHHRRFLTFVVIAAIITSCYAYMTDENKPTGYITYSEEHAADWILNNIKRDNAVFTDFRLSADLVGNGHLRVTGINEVEQKLTSVISSLNDIYYNNKSDNAKMALNKIILSNNQKMDYLFFSKQMTEEIPGIKGYNYAFKPAPDDFTIKYDTSNFTNRIYDNGISFIYRIYL